MQTYWNLEDFKGSFHKILPSGRPARRLLESTSSVRDLLTFSVVLQPAMALHAAVDRVLFSEEQIAGRVSELSSQISRDFQTVSCSVTVVGVATGAFMFLADIVRKIEIPVSVDFVRVESYGSGTESSGHPTISSDLKVDVLGKHVILVEDIVDTGNTLACLISHMKSRGASSVSVCTLLDKPTRRSVHLQLVGDGKFYRAFECPDEFVVGYGMDFAELYRNLPYVGVLKSEIYT